MIFSDEAPFRIFGTSGKSQIQRRNGERYHMSCIVPTVKHPDTTHVWGCFSVKGTGSLCILPKNTAMNAKWYREVLQNHLLPTIEQRFGEDPMVFQHDGASYHNAKATKEWIQDKGINILTPWPGNSPDLNPIENLWSILKNRVDKQKPTNSGALQTLLKEEWGKVTEELSKKLVCSMPKRIADILKAKGAYCKY